MAATLGINIDEAFRQVHLSNMSKLCSSEKEANETVENYKKKYESGNSIYDSPDYKKTLVGNKYIVYNKSSGKILKNINYHAVKFNI